MAGVAPPVLEIDDLSVSFRTHDGPAPVLVGVSLRVEQGEILGLVGEAGSGKSVTALSIPQLIPTPPGEFVRGNVRVHGESVLAMSPDQLRKLRAERIGVVLPSSETILNPVVSVEEQLIDACVGRIGHGSTVRTGSFFGWRSSAREQRRRARDIAIDLLDRVGFPNPGQRIKGYAHELSAAQRQQVLLALGLAGQPDLLIADEPTAGLDVATRARVLGLLREHARACKRTVLLATRNLGVAAQVCDRVVVLYAGRIVESGDVRHVFGSPAHPYTLGLLRAVPTLTTRRGALGEIAGPAPNRLNPSPGCAFQARCPRVMDLCRVDPPPPTVTTAAGTEVACHLFGGPRPLHSTPRERRDP
jgi:oligopeptide/dipeptide ABC transporter ATP-binding protein